MDPNIVQDMLAEESGERVELATLSLPAIATKEGLETGEGIQLTLEAPKETVELLQQQQQAEEDEATAAGEEPPQPALHISAVVDLEKLSELVGVSEEDFITGLHQDVHQAAQEDDGEGKAGEEADEETPLIEKPEQETETTTVETNQIQLLADPFIESLARVLPTVDEDTVLDAMSVGHVSVGPSVVAITEAAATTTTITAADGDGDEEPQHLAHDAFLLSIPVPSTSAIDPTSTTKEAAEEETTNKFVLALPEIHLVDPSARTEPSDMSDDLLFVEQLERAMSLLPTELPTDVQAVHLEATEVKLSPEDPHHTAVHLDIVVERKVPLIGYIILFAGLLALASVGAALDLQQGGVTPVMKTLWRQTATCVVLSPMVLLSIHRDGFPQLSRSEWILLAVSSAAYTYMTLAFVLALEMTTLANAFVLSNMTSLVIIAARAALGLPVLLAEGAGAVIGFMGAAICAGAAGESEGGIALDKGVSTEETTDLMSNNLALLGNLVALSASFGTAGYLLIAKNLRPKMDLMVFMFSVMGLGTLFLLTFALVLGGSNNSITFDMHPVHGFFGWLNLQLDRLPLELYMAIVCNCLGTMGYIAVLKYFDAIVPATVMLLEPVVGALLGTLAGTAPLPGLQTWLGDLVVAGGTFLVIKAGAKKTESIDATEALRPVKGDGTDEDELRSIISGTRGSIKKSPMPLIRKSPMPLKRKGLAAGGDTTSDASAKVIWETSA